jgi:hypothetical protein
METALRVVRTMYAEVYRLHEELAEIVESKAAGLEVLPTWTWESQTAETPESCVRARLARYYVPVGSGTNIKGGGDPEEERHHLRLNKTDVATFVSAELHGKVDSPALFYGLVDQFDGKLGKGKLALLHRGDLAGFLEAADFSVLRKAQPVFGRTRSHTARLTLAKWSPLADVNSAAELERLADRVVAAFKARGLPTAMEGM